MIDTCTTCHRFFEAVSAMDRRCDRCRRSDFRLSDTALAEGYGVTDGGTPYLVSRPAVVQALREMPDTEGPTVRIAFGQATTPPPAPVEEDFLPLEPDPGAPWWQWGLFLVAVATLALLLLRGRT